MAFEKISRLFVQVANGVNARANKVDLTISMENAERMLVKLIEGEDSKDFPSPPMQLVMDQLAHVKVE